MEASLLESPGLIDLILVFTLLEGGALALWRRRSGRGLSDAAVVRTLVPGICLLLALRAALAGAAWPFVPMALALALIAHLVDVAGRWRG
jgi:hypothetical protein